MIYMNIFAELIMDTVDFVLQSKEAQALKKLCTNLNLNYRLIVKSPEGLYGTVGSMERRESEEILVQSLPAEPEVIILPKLPMPYAELMSGTHQYKMVTFTLKLIQLYIGKSGVLGEGILNIH